MLSEKLLFLGDEMRNLILNLNKYILLLDADCSILGDELNEILQEIFTAFRIAVPILVLVLIGIDLLSAVTSGDEKNFKQAQSKIVKRLIIGVVIFFIPSLVNLVLSWIGIANGTCGIG